ncbi:MAG: protein translocase subunit SecF [Oscillospiraceae bacterium]|nr:protein translocase subunit SecF [Oscillospiraceae bacterium]
MSKTTKSQTSGTGSDIKRINFTGKSKIFYVISAVLIALSVLVTILGVDVAIEFKGGTMITYSFAGEIIDSEAESRVEEVTGANVTVQQGELFQSDRKKLSISFVSNEGFTAEKQSALTAALQETYADNDIEILDSTDVAASSGRNFFIKCIVAVVFSAVILILYIAFRFKRISGWSSGVCAVIALLHDIVVTYGAFVLIGFQINSNFIAVVLTILGCSINNTIVVYDRIRENRKLMPMAEIHDLVNISTTQSMTRSFRTSITTVVTMLIISIVASVYGVTSILSFSVPIIVGMMVGTYSSLCLAPCLWVSWQTKGKKA